MLQQSHIHLNSASKQDRTCLSLSVVPSRSLSCQRISLHKNMFLSFIINSIVTILWLSLSVANNQAKNASNEVSHIFLYLIPVKFLKFPILNPPPTAR